MKKDYLNFTATDFLKDDYFLQWRMFETSKDKKYWNELIRNNPEIQPEISRAIEIFNSLKLNNYELNSDEKEQVLLNIQNRITKQKNNRKQLFIRWVSAAACIVLISLLSFHYIYRSGISDKTIIVSEILNDPANKDVKLLLADKQIITIERNAEIHYNTGGNVIVTTGTQLLDKATIDKTNKNLNKLIVPKGKRSYLVLEDGTKIWANSGTTIEFPNAFDANKREIKVDGEIYIEVEKDKMRPFTVNASSFDVKVLGTKFNLSAYKGDNSGSVVLVEGSISAGDKKTRTLLQPDHLLNIRGEKHTVSKVDVYDYICWKDGLLIFRSKPLNEILTTLSRYYDVEFVCTDNTEKMKCTGKLVLFDSIDEVLNTVSNTIPVRCIKDGTSIRIVKLQ